MTAAPANLEHLPIDGLIPYARRSRTPIPHARRHFYALLARSVRPRPLTTVSAWSDKYRILTSKGSGEPGQWRTDRTPYLREILDSLSVNSPAQRIVLMFAAQLGKTEVGLNWICYVMQHAPGPMLTVLPTLEVRKRWVRQRLDPLLTETPVIRALFDARRARDAGNAEDMKDFPCGMLVIGGANSPASLASMPIRYVLCDEVDRFPWEVGQEGDPLGLIDERTKTFPRRKVLLVSTPTVKGASRIEGEYEKSDMRQFHVPCPHCGELQVLRWRHDDGRYGLIHNAATGAVYYACIHCGERIDEHHKPAMLAAGRWIPRHPERAVRGYHLSGLYSPIGLGFTWAELWRKWEEAHGDTANLKRFINTTLGESWEEQGDSIEDLALIARLEDYPDTLQASLRTAGVDVQKDRLEATIVAWGAGEEGWLIDHLILPGDTARPEVWEALHDALTDAGIAFAAIDSGYNTSMVYAFTEKRRWSVAVKGITGMGRPLIEDEKKRRQRLRNRRKKAAHVEPLGVDQGKALLYARLKLPVPGPAYLHFPRDPAFDDEYFAQLAAEKLVTKIKGTRPFQEWVQTRPRNEALDCLLYALAALRLSGKTPAAPVMVPAGVVSSPPAQPGVRRIGRIGRNF
jgi:phage terminase large subunit GpA-like protein